MKKNINGLSIIIPFHNEAKRILPLIESFNNQSHVDNCEIIFVDDHSSDNTALIIAQQLKLQHLIIQSSAEKGKKFAIHQGINQAKNDAILTLDADVSFNKNYLHELMKLELNDMVVLPVRMTGKNLFKQLSSIEFNWLQILTFGSKKNSLCNGANLLFSKKSYDEAYPLRSDFDRASGDDYFLLQALQQKGAFITKKNEKKLRVDTPAPENWNELVAQRRRWFSKTKGSVLNPQNSMGLMLVVFQFLFICACVLVWWYPLLIIALLIKLLTECVAAGHKSALPFPKLLLVVFVHQFWFPIYLLGMIFYPKRSEEKWT